MVIVGVRVIRTWRLPDTRGPIPRAGTCGKDATRRMGLPAKRSPISVHMIAVGSCSTPCRVKKASSNPTGWSSS